MKPLVLAAVWVLAGVPAWAADYPAPTPVQVNVSTETEQLAEGYAAAFSQLSNNVTLIVLRNGQKDILPPVRSIRAVNGVLLVEVGRGVKHVINPREVLVLTDDPAARN